MEQPKPFVLVVHGESEMRGLLYALLERDGYPVATRATGFGGLRYLAQAKPEVIVCDASLPDMESREFVRQVRRASLDARVIVLGRPWEGSALPGAESGEPVAELCLPLSGRELRRAVAGSPARIGA